MLSGHERYEADWNQILEDRIKAGEPMPGWSDPGLDRPGVPADRAEPLEHLAFWLRYGGGSMPTAEARRRILEAIRMDVAATPQVLRFLPQDKPSARIVAELLPKLPAYLDEDGEKARETRAWVYQYSGLLRDEVLADCQKARWRLYQDRNGSDPSLNALMAREPAEANRLFKTLMEGSDQGLAVVAARLLLEMAPGEESFRRKLIEAASSPVSPDEVKEIAVETLVSQKWEGRESWILDSLGQEGVLEAIWFWNGIRNEPDRWIPLLAGKLEKPGMARNRAVELLVWFDRPDSIRPLLPWLKDRDWSFASEDGLKSMIGSLAKLDIQECADGLVQWVTEDNPAETKTWAADALVRYKRADAVPVLKRLLLEFGNTDRYHRGVVFQSIQKLGGFEPEETVAALEAYFNAFPETPHELGTVEGAMRSDNPLIHDGAGFANALLQTSPELLSAIERRADVVEKDNPVLAKHLRQLAVRYFAAGAGRILAKELEEGRLDEPGLVLGLTYRREKNPLWNGGDFREPAGKPGTVGGLASVLSGDGGLMHAALARDDGGSRLAVLAAATFTGDLLDLGQVRKLLDEENEELADAAWSYLLNRADLAALAVVDEVKTAKEPDISMAYKLMNTSRADQDLVRSISGISVPPGEVMSLFHMSGGQGERSVLFYPERAFAIQDFGEGRRGICELNDAQIARLKDYSIRYRIDDLPSMRMPVSDGVRLGYAHVTSTRRRFFVMGSPAGSLEELRMYDDRKYSEGSVVYAGLIGLFEKLFNELDLKIHRGDGVEVLTPRERGHVGTVWKKGGDLRVFVNSVVKGAPGFWQRVDEKTGAFLGAADEPPEVPRLETWQVLFPGSGKEDDPEIHPWQVRSGDAFVHSGRFKDADGLWLCRAGKDPELLLEGFFHGERVSSDGKWCVVVKRSGSAMTEAQKVVRINLETKETFPLDLEEAGSFSPIAFINGSGKFLIRRARQILPLSGGERIGPEAAEYHLLNPADGSSQLVKGDFIPLKRKLSRPLQAGANPLAGWATKAEKLMEGAVTRVGLYDSGDFKFKTAREVKGIAFESTDMWVDEEKRVIHAVADGDLVKIPLDGK
ncbi:hypothetical protein GCM10023212_19670 [Luteolibacter yonseiensis]